MRSDSASRSRARLHHRGAQRKWLHYLIGAVESTPPVHTTDCPTLTMRRAASVLAPARAILSGRADASRRCCVLLQQQQQQQRRQIFTDKYLGLDKFTQRRNAERLARATTLTDRSTPAEAGGGGGFVDGLRISFAENGLRSLFAEDIRLLVQMADNVEDAR